MLFFINESVAKLVERQDAVSLKVLSELLEAWRRNKCLIDASRSTFETLCANESLKGYVGPFKRKQGLSGIYSHISFFVQLAAKGDNTNLSFQKAKGRILTIEPYQDIYFFSTNLIICENSHDYKFYCWGANRFQDSEIKETLSLNTSRSNGGGSQMSYECDLVNSDKRLGLVIYDSDMKYINAPIGITAKSIERKMSSLHSLYLWPHRLTSHEIENLIPIEILTGLKFKQHKSFLVKMSDNKAHSMFDMLFIYFDFKKGILPSTLRAYRDELCTSDFNNVKDLLIKLGVHAEKIEKALRTRWNPKIKEDVLLGGWGDKLLQQSVDFINYNNVNTTLLSYQEIEWYSLVRDIWSIGCSHCKLIN